MAYTKIHAIKATVDKAIEYICNPEKTDEKMFVSSYACAPETAALDFKYTLDHCLENSPNKAYHLILHVDKLRAEYQALETQKKELTATYKSCEKEVRDLKRKQENLNQYLGRTQTDPVQEQQTKIKNHSL